LRKYVIAALVCTTLSFFGFEARSQDANAEANKLFVEAVSLYRGSQSETGSSKSESYAKVRALFDQILQDHPDSKPATIIAQGGSPGGVLIASLPSSMPKGWNDGKRGIARDLLAKYDDDVGAIEAVAEAALYAHLAWAAYDAGEPKQFLEQRGWKIIEANKGDRVLVGDVTATLFEGPQGQHVLAFRGSVTGGDWVTNVGGTLSPTPLLNGQVIDALKLADEVAQKFPNVVFVGHSLGGRLAQASSLKTGKVAYAFNSAPVGYNEIRKMGFQELIQGKMRRFRSPQDQLSGVFTESDTVVANIEKVDANALFNLMNLKDYTHAMNVLAQSMKSVAFAWREGWITAYLNEQGVTDGEESVESNSKVHLVAGESCQITGESLSPSQIKTVWVERSLSGKTASGASWKLALGKLSNDGKGEARFTNSKGEASSGFWKLTDGDICQSYNNASSWVCHNVHRCKNSGRAIYAMSSASGEVASLVTPGASLVPIPKTADKAENADDWRKEKEVAKALQQLVQTTRSGRFSKAEHLCENLYGPVSNDMRKALFQDTSFKMRRFNINGNRAVQWEGELIAPNNMIYADKRARSDLYRNIYYCPENEHFFQRDKAYIDELSNFKRGVNLTIPPANYALNTVKQLKVDGKECFISVPWGDPTSVDWSGQCEGGKPVGTGTILWRKDGQIVWKSKIGPHHGLVFRNGVLQVVYNFNNLSVNLANCNDKKFNAFEETRIKRAIAIHMPAGAPKELFQNSWLTNFVLNEAGKVLAEKCKLRQPKSQSGQNVKIYLQQSKDERDYIVSASSRGEEGIAKITWSSVNNKAVQALNKEIESDNARERQFQRQMERQAAERVRQREMEIRRQEQARQQQAAREAAQERQVELNALKTQIDVEWAAHMNNMFSGNYVIKNVGDLLQYNKTKAISLLSQGVTLQLATQNMTFQDGTIVITHEHDPTDIYRPVRQAELVGLSEFDIFRRQTQTIGVDYSGPSVNVVCRLSASALEKLDGQSAARFDAKMQSLNGRSAIFDCELK